MVTVGPNGPVTAEALSREMSVVAACSAEAGAPPLSPSPQTMILDVFITKSAVAKVTVMTSSGNPAFDRKAIQCLQNLPLDFGAKISGDLIMFVAVHANNGAVVPEPSDAIVQPRPAPPDTVASQQGAPPGSCAAYYPPIAVRLNQEGDAELVFTITADGTVRDVSVTKSSGYELLDQAAARCAEVWRYKPAMRDGAPIDVQWHSVVRFRLDGGPTDPETIATQRSMNKLFHDSYACLKATQISEDELAKSSHAATGLAVHFSRGVISGVDITHSSGDTTLDGLAVNCFLQQKYDVETAQALVHQKDWSVPVVWSVIKPKRP